MSGTETSDPVVAVFYGAGVHPSLRAGLAAATDLVAGQPGPWRLSDEDLAEACAAMVARLRPPVAIGDVAGSVVAHLDEARRGLFEVFTDHGPELPIHLRHHVEELEGRLTAFLSGYGDQLRGLGAPAAPAGPEVATVGDDGPVPPSGRTVFPSIDAATGYGAADWRAVIAARGLAVPEVKAELIRRCETAGRTPPSTLNSIRGRRDLAALMLRVISDFDQAAHPEPGS